MSTASNVTAGKPKIGGAVSCAPHGTTVPTTVAETLNSAFVNLGYISDDGLTNINSPTVTIIKAWGGDNVLVSQTDKPDKFKYKLIEILNENVQKAVYGDENVTGTLSEGITLDATTKEVEAKTWVIDMILRNGALKRIVIPTGVLTELAEIKYKDGEVAGYEVTIDALPDANGSTHKEYTIRPTTTSGSTTGDSQSGNGSGTSSGTGTGG